MAIHIQSGKNKIKADLNAKVQSMPFKIQADCDAPVTKYFDSYVKTNENGGKSLKLKVQVTTICSVDVVLTGSFRGYPLKGKVVQNPEGYVGLVLHESVKPATENEDRKFFVVHNFDSIVYWNWDKTPSKNDALDQALVWIDIAEAVSV